MVNARVKRIGAGNGNVCGGGYRGRRGVAHGDGLHDVGAVAGVVGGGPGAGDDFGAAATVTDDVAVIDFHRAAGVRGNGQTGDVGSGVSRAFEHQVRRDRDGWRRGVLHG